MKITILGYLLAIDVNNSLISHCTLAKHTSNILSRAS